MANVQFDIIKEGKGRVRIVPKMGRLPELEEYREVAESLLQNGLRDGKKEKLKDPSSRDFLDTIALIPEFEEDFGNQVKTVVFSCKSGDVQVTANNINQIPKIVKELEKKEGNSYQAHRTAIREAVEESFQK